MPGINVKTTPPTGDDDQQQRPAVCIRGWREKKNRNYTHVCSRNTRICLRPRTPYYWFIDCCDKPRLPLSKSEWWWLCALDNGQSLLKMFAVAHTGWLFVGLVFVLFFFRKLQDIVWRIYIISGSQNPGNRFLCERVCVSDFWRRATHNTRKHSATA